MIGAPKCGTTSLAQWLGSQPYAALAKYKETLYFTDFADLKWQGPGIGFVQRQPLTPEAFDAQFAAKPQAELRIEASTDNMSCPAAVDNIARFAERADVNKVWLIAILRDPIERIVSEYEHTLRLGWQSNSLLEALKLEKGRKSKGYHPLFRHIERSCYATQIARYREKFGDNLLILDFHRIREASERNRLLSWMGYSDEAENDLPHDNKRSVVARPGTVGMLRRNKKLLNLGRTVLPKRSRPAVRKWITGGTVERYEMSEEEYSFIYSVLKDEIKACIEASDIPTENWDVSAP